MSTPQVTRYYHQVYYYHHSESWNSTSTGIKSPCILLECPYKRTEYNEKAVLFKALGPKMLGEGSAGGMEWVREVSLDAMMSGKVTLSGEHPEAHLHVLKNVRNFVNLSY